MQEPLDNYEIETKLDNLTTERTIFPFLLLMSLQFLNRQYQEEFLTEPLFWPESN